jgi:6-phosphogluconolactonase
MSYSWFHAGAGLVLGAAVLVSALTADAKPADAPTKIEKVRLYVGTYTDTTSKGIYRFDFDCTTGKLSNKALAVESNSPSFLAIHPNQKFLYAANEAAEFGAKKTGAVSAFAIDAKTGDLTLINQQTSGGSAPCHLVVDKAGKNVLVANYGDGVVEVVPIDANGKLGEPSSTHHHAGKSINPGNQEGPHAHSVNLDAANRFAVVADLGVDKLYVYRFDGKRGTLTTNNPHAAFNTEPGDGPRHFAFHPNGKNAYVINEIGMTVTALSYDAEFGTFKKVQSISTLPKDAKKEKNYSTAEVVVHPSGKFLYGSNRGHDSIVAYTIDADTGKLTLIGHQDKGIKEPRNFNIDPTGAFMLVANQNADSIVVFRIDPKTGELKETGTTMEVGKPVCLKMIPLPG